MRTKFVLSTWILALGIVTGCSSSSGGGSSGGSGGGGSSGSSGSSSSSSQTCRQAYLCINGGCKCTGTKNKDQACCDPNASSCAGDATNCEKGYCESCESSGSSGGGGAAPAPTGGGTGGTPPPSGGSGSGGGGDDDS